MTTQKAYQDKKELLSALKNGKTGLQDELEEEMAVLAAYENGELQSVDPTGQKRKELIEAARNMPTKTRRISIRLSELDLEQLKFRASETGIPYQTLIGSLVHQYAAGRLTVQI